MFHASNKRTFTEHDKLKALAIVNIFETSKPFGGYAAVAVLDDGAGVSYGMSQFTHRSGSLRAVVERYLANNGVAGRDILQEALPLLKSRSAASIGTLAADERFKRALSAAAATREMKDAQNFVATERYLRPALKICGEKGFCLPLSLAVVYDSVVHGGWERIAEGVKRVRTGVMGASKDAAQTEKAWVTEYVRRRHTWLTASARLKATNYRTRFFLSQIATGNWELKLPLNVHGVRLGSVNSEQGSVNSEQGIVNSGQEADPGADLLASAVSQFDRVEGVVSGVVARTDRARSLWATVAGSASQAAWAVFGFLVGLPREVWITVAVIAGALTLLYLYRQIVLGRIRELRNEK